MKKILLATTVMAVFSAHAQDVSQADIEAYLQAHPEVVQQYAAQSADRYQPESTRPTEPLMAEPQSASQPTTKMAPGFLEMIKNARADGIIKPDGHFEVKGDEGEITGQFLCSDTEISEKLQTLDTEMGMSNLDIEKARKVLDATLRCVSISHFKVKDNASTVQFTGNLKFPVFADNSHVSILVSDKKIDVAFKLNGTEQQVDINVHSLAGEKLTLISFQYDAERMAVPFELGVLGQIMDYVTRSSLGGPSTDFKANIMRQLQTWAQENNMVADNVFKINNAEIYQPDGKKVLILKGEKDGRYLLRVFNSVAREFISASWKDETLKIDLNFPQSSGRVLKSETKFSPMFREKYSEIQKQLVENGGDPRRWDASEEQMLQLVAGLKQDVTLYGLDGQPLARLKAKLNDTITSAARPENVLDYATLNILKPSNNCFIRSVTFTKANPNTMTVCDTNGCSDQEAFSAFAKIQPCLEAEMGAVFDKFGSEITNEMDRLSQVYIPGFSDGYNAAMNRYRTNEILNAAALVSIASTSANGGMGEDSDLSVLGGIKTMKLDGVVQSDSAIRGTKDGVVTIEVDPKYTKDIMPLLKNLSGNRFVSGCTPDTNICVINMGMPVK